MKNKIGSILGGESSRHWLAGHALYTQPQPLALRIPDTAMDYSRLFLRCLRCRCIIATLLRLILAMFRYVKCIQIESLFRSARMAIGEGGQLLACVAADGRTSMRRDVFISDPYHILPCNNQGVPEHSSLGFVQGDLPKWPDY
jgi:hypothetical protein